jgi:integrase
MVRKRGYRWYFDFMVRRVRYRGAIPEARTKWQAEKVEARIRLEVYENRYGRSSGGQLLSEFVDKVFLPWSKANKRSSRDDELHANVICDFFAGKTFDQISPLLVEKFKKQRRESVTRYERERTPASVNRELAALSRIFSLAIDNGILETNPCRKVKRLRENNERRRYLTSEEEERLMAVLTGRRAHLRPVVLLAINTGMRRGELLSLMWRNVDFQRSVIHVTNTKTGKDRDVPMNSDVRYILLDLQRQGKDEAFVFKNRKTGVNLIDVKRAFNGACVDAGIEDFRFHDLRHTAGTRLADAGADAFTIAEILGHATLQMTKRYTHATDERKRKAVEALSNLPKKIVTRLSQSKSGDRLAAAK